MTWTPWVVKPLDNSGENEKSFKHKKTRGGHRPLCQVVRVLLSLCSFNTSPLYYLRAWHRLRPGDLREKLQHIECSLRPEFGRNANWLLEQYHRIWLAVEINGSWRRLFLILVREWSDVSREKERYHLYGNFGEKFPTNATGVFLAPKTGTWLSCTINKIPVDFSLPLDMKPGAGNADK